MFRFGKHTFKSTLNRSFEIKTQRNKRAALHTEKDIL